MRDLLAEHGHVLLGLAEAVLERLEHRLHVRERRPQVVARPGHELAAGVEESLELSRHLVEGRGELGDLGRSRLRARAPRGRRAASSTDASRTRRSSRRSIARAREPRPVRSVADAAVTARIFTSSPMWNIDPARQQHGAEREADGERRRGRRAGGARSGGAAAGRRATSPTARVSDGDERAAADHRDHGDEPVADAPDRLAGDFGSDGSSSIFSRRRRTWTVTVPVSSAAV